MEQVFEPIIFNTSFGLEGIIDGFESFIWTERYNAYGDFELYLPFELADFNIIRRGYYVGIRQSDYMMIIESIEINTDVENGDHVIVRGRSLESIPERRVIFGEAHFDGQTPYQIVRSLLWNQLLIAGDTSSPRRIPMEIDDFQNDHGKEITVDCFCENLYDEITVLLDSCGMGFHIYYNNGLRFKFLDGVDRSYNQDVNPYVIFSNKFENLAGSNYLESDKDYYNAAIVAGDSNDEPRIVVEAVASNDISGMNRREVFIDKSDFARTQQVNDEYGEREITYEKGEYADMLVASVKAELDASKIETSFEGSVLDHGSFLYGRDYFIGDIVQVVNEYNMAAICRVTEVIRSMDSNGYTVTNTFQNFE